MKKVAIFLALPLLLAAGCSSAGAQPEAPHKECNAVYYWRTVFDPDSSEIHFLKEHEIGRIYLRMFDVSIDNQMSPATDRTEPNATVRIPYETFYELKEAAPGTEFVPVVYVTLDALKDSKGHEGRLATNIVKRVRNMCSYNEVPDVAEMQLDCDWTQSTEQSFFRLCDSVKAVMAESGLHWRLSATIRLHQLSRQAPPVDCGVLMVYNTGSFDDPDATNSIISESDVKPYLKHLSAYPLHLDVAYPTYSWQLLFRNRRFVGLTDGVDVSDTLRFRSDDHGKTYVAKTDVPIRDRLIRKGDILRCEISDYGEVSRVKALIERHLEARTHSNIIYHLDSSNLSKYTSDEITDIFTVGNTHH